MWRMSSSGRLSRVDLDALLLGGRCKAEVGMRKIGLRGIVAWLGDCKVSESEEGRTKSLGCTSGDSQTWKGLKQLKVK